MEHNLKHEAGLKHHKMSKTRFMSLPHLHQVSAELLTVGHPAECQSLRRLPLQFLAETAFVG